MFRSLARTSRFSLAPLATHRAASTAATPAIANLEARWRNLSPAEQSTIIKQLETAQKSDWLALSLEEKRAAYWVAFGPHGPREPVHQSGNALKVFTGVGLILGVSTGLFYILRQNAQEKPRTISREWEEATNEYLKGQKANPITGISSEGYKGKGFVTNS